ATRIASDSPITACAPSRPPVCASRPSTGTTSRSPPRSSSAASCSTSYPVASSRSVTAVSYRRARRRPALASSPAACSYPPRLSAHRHHRPSHPAATAHPAAATKRDRRFFPIAGCPPPRGFVQRGFADALAPPSAASLAELCPALGLGKPPTL